MKQKLFIIASRVPYPLDKGDKLRLYHQLRYLKDQFEIMLCVLDDSDTAPEHIEKLKEIVPNIHIIKLKKWQIYLNVISGVFRQKPFQVYYFYQRQAQSKINRLIETFKPDHIYCQLIRSAEYVKNYHNIKKTIDYQDTFSKGMERRAEKEGWKKIFFESEHKRLLKYENLIFDYFDHHTIISNEDRNAIFHEKRNEIKIVPNGIDTSFFSPTYSADKKKYNLVFVGNMSYAPNVNSVQYIVNEILPYLKEQNPETKLLIAGSNPSKEVQNLASENVTVSGWLDDIRTAYASADIFIAPMQIGTGLQNKLLEAMSMGIPCITSSLANKSLNAKHEEEALICENEQEYINSVLRLLADQELAKKLSKNSRTFVQENFSWEESVKDLTNLIAD